MEKEFSRKDAKFRAVPLRKILRNLNVFPMISGTRTEILAQFPSFFGEKEFFYWKNDFEKSLVGFRPYIEIDMDSQCKNNEEMYFQIIQLRKIWVNRHWSCLYKTGASKFQILRNWEVSQFRTPAQLVFNSPCHG